MLCVAQTDGKRPFQVIIIIIFYVFTLQQSRKRPKRLTGRSPCGHTTQGRSFRNKLLLAMQGQEIWFLPFFQSQLISK